MQTFKLTTPQQNIWNLHQYYAGTAIANQCGAVIFDRPIDVAILRNAVRTIIREQSALRLRLVRNEAPEQYISEEDDPQIPAMTFADDEELDAYAERSASEPITAYDAPLYRFTVFRLQDGRSGVVAVLSHLTADAWSFALMVKEIDAICRHRTGDTATDASRVADYRSFVRSEEAYLASDRYRKDCEYWEARYTARPELSPIKPEAGTKETAKARRIQRRLDRALSTDIDTFCEEHRTTPAVLFETVVLLYLARINREHKTVTIGVPVLNRADREEKRMIGMFISTVPLTIDVREDMTVRELLDAVTGAHRGIFRHQRYPYAEILRGLRERQDFTGNLYDVMVSVQNAETNTDAATRWYFSGCSELPLTLHVDDRDHTGRRMLTVDYQRSVFPQAGEIDLLIARLEYILEQMIDNPLLSVREIRILPDAERELLVERFNDTHMDYPWEKCVHELFAEQAAKTPKRTALVFEDQEFTYQQIDEMSNSLAHVLRASGIGRNDVVPLIARRDWSIIVAMIAVLRAGGAYMPISPDYPIERIRTMMEIAEARVALCYGAADRFDRQREIGGNIDAVSIHSTEDENVLLSVAWIDLESFDFAAQTEPLENISQSNDLCYIITTSGSTGVPKAVSQRHRNVINYASNVDENSVLHHVLQAECHNIVSVTNIVFDIFVTESLLPLLNGLTIYFANDEEVLSQTKLADLFKRNVTQGDGASSIDVMQTTPTKMRSYLMDKSNLGYLKSLKTIILGGEAFPPDLYTELRNMTDAHIFNIYGPAETTVWSSNAEVTSAENITIGRPIANTQIYILDGNQNLLPIGAPGELCIAGDGVGKGYLNQPELTAERFVPTPFATDDNHHGKIMYRTGDLARWREDGEIEYLGRIDTQVKIRGLRIELGEIESVMATFPGVGLAAAAAQKDESGRQYLVGYYKEGHSTV